MRWTEQQVWDTARSMGLDPFPTEFHTVPAHVLYDIAARGLPGRYSHWCHGKEYWHEITRHEHGMGRIYELVINANPSHAFLLDVNSDVVNLMVMLHVLGHTDFFKQNRVFQETDRDMPDRTVLRAERIRRYEEIYGIDRVEQTLDALRSVEWYVDPDGYSPDLKRTDSRTDHPGDSAGRTDEWGLPVGRPDGRRAEEADQSYAHRRRFAGLPCRDILAFLIAEAPLDDWQRDLAEIVRLDGLYFWPQIRTKTLNEGWASFWHGKMMRETDLTDGEFIEYAKVNAGVVSAHPGRLNPYWLGLHILCDVERRFGREKLFDIRRMETDVSFVRNYLTPELVEELGLVRFGPRGEEWVVTEDNWERVRDGIANDFAGRFPAVQVVDKEYDSRGTLLLEHLHDGRPLKKQSALKVLGHLQSLWGHPIALATKEKGQKVIWTHDGREATTTILPGA